MKRRKRCDICGKLAGNLVRDKEKGYCRKCHNGMIKGMEKKLEHARKIFRK